LRFHVTETNRHDVTAILPLVEAIPPIGGKRGRPQRWPEVLQGDADYIFFFPSQGSERTTDNALVPATR